MRRTIVCLLVAVLHHAAAAQGRVDRALSAVWSLEGRWTGVAVDEATATIYTLGYGRGAEVDLAGHIRREFPLPPGEARTLRLAKFPEPALVTFTTWGPSGVNTYDLRGNRLWSYQAANGVDSVWIGDVDGQDSDEVVIGYNGNSGVHVVDGTGQIRWKSTAIGNVWQVGVGDVLGHGRSQVVATSASGKAHVFNGDGRGRVDISAPGFYLTMVPARKLSNDATATIFAAGTQLDSKTSAVMALASDGTRRWQRQLPGSVATADIASGRPWLALGTREGHVFVVDAVRGEIVGAADMQGSAEVAWVGDPPLLLVATGTSLNAFRVAP